MAPPDVSVDTATVVPVAAPVVVEMAGWDVALEAEPAVDVVGPLPQQPLEAAATKAAAAMVAATITRPFHSRLLVSVPLAVRAIIAIACSSSVVLVTGLGRPESLLAGALSRKG